MAQHDRGRSCKFEPQALDSVDVTHKMVESDVKMDTDEEEDSGDEGDG